MYTVHGTSVRLCFVATCTCHNLPVDIEINLETVFLCVISNIRFIEVPRTLQYDILFFAQYTVSGLIYMYPQADS